MSLAHLAPNKWRATAVASALALLDIDDADERPEQFNCDQALFD